MFKTNEDIQRDWTAIPERGSSVRNKNRESDWLNDQNKELRKRIEVLEEKLKRGSPSRNYFSKTEAENELDIIKKENR